MRCEPGLECSSEEKVEMANVFVVHEAVRVGVGTSGIARFRAVLHGFQLEIQLFPWFFLGFPSSFWLFLEILDMLEKGPLWENDEIPRAARAARVDLRP